MMTTLRHIALILWCLAYMALAGQATIRWNPNPESGVSYQLYRDGIMLVSTTATEATVEVQAGDILTIKATKDGLQSGPSNRIQVVEVQVSLDLQSWATSGYYFIPADSAVLFTRLKLRP
jgi:hypothetical protein